MALPEYENLTESELIEADHYAETGNREGLMKMQRISRDRSKANSRGYSEKTHKIK